MTAAFWHFGLTVSDLDKSIAFYRGIVGMEVGARAHSANAQFGALTNNPGAELDAVFLTLGGFTLQLLHYRAKAGPVLALDHNKTGSPHLAFYVEDANAKYQEVAGRAVITSPLITNAAGTIRSFYVADPDGMPVEFVETLK